jgi:peptidyl-prolyl cis-trans isomerase C
VAHPFEAVRGAVAMALRQQTYVAALRQVLQLLAGRASLEGVQLDACDTPLVQFPNKRTDRPKREMS